MKVMKILAVALLLLFTVYVVNDYFRLERFEELVCPKGQHAANKVCVQNWNATTNVKCSLPRTLKTDVNGKQYCG